MPEPVLACQINLSSALRGNSPLSPELASLVPSPTGAFFLKRRGTGGGGYHKSDQEGKGSPGAGVALGGDHIISPHLPRPSMAGVDRLVSLLPMLSKFIVRFMGNALGYACPN